MPSNATSNQFVIRDIPASVFANGVDGVSGNVISVANIAALNGAAQYTMEIWVRPVSSKAHVIYDNSDSGVTNSIFMSIDANYSLFAYQTIGGVAKNIVGTTARLDPGRWNLITVSYNGALISIFLNGSLIGSLAATGTLGSNATTFRIGGYYNGASTLTFHGYIHRPRLYLLGMTLQEHQDRFYSNRTSAALQAALIMDLDTSLGGSGTTLTDLSGNGNTGTIGASASWNSDSPFKSPVAARAPQTALSFSAAAATNQVTFAHVSAYTFSKIVTCSFWAKAYAVQSDAEIFGKNNVARYPFVFRYNNSNGRVQFGAYDGTFNPSSPTNTALLPKDGWVHFVGTRDGVRLKLYRNGTLIADVADTTVSTTDNSDSMTVGNRGGSAKWFDGLVSDVRVHAATLTQAQVSDLYLRGRNPVAPVLSSPLSNGGGSVATDVSTNANHGTIAGATWVGDAPFKQDLLARHYESSIEFNGTTSALVKTTPTGINTGTLSRSASGWIFLKSNAIQTFVQFKVNGSNQSPAFALGQISNTYYYAFDTLHAGNNLTMTAAQFNANFPLFKWLHVAYVMTTTNISLYVNGVLVISTNWGTVINSSAYDNLFIGKTQDSVNTNQYWFGGRMQDVRIHNGALTQAEIQAEFLNGKASSTLVSRFIGQDGAGTLVDDSVGSNDATTANIVWNYDTPFKRGRSRDGNLVKNGTFDYAPVLTSITNTSSSVWVDGTASGSTTNDLFGWYKITGVGTFAASFDTTVKYKGAASMKIEATNITGRGRIMNTPFETTTTPELVQKYGIPVLGGMDYRLSAYVKTNDMPASSLKLAVQFFNAAGASISTTNSAFFSSTQDFTLYTAILTAPTNASYVRISFEMSVAGAIAQAWIDSLSFAPVFPDGQVPANGNLVKNYDCEIIPTFVALQNTAGRWMDGTAGGSTTNSTYKWAIPAAAISATAYASFDTTVKHWGQASLKLEVTDATGTVIVANVLNAASGGSAGTIPVLANTTYSFSAWMKTSTVPTNGVYMDVREFNSLGGTITTTSSNKLSGTNDWTKVTGSFTTNSATKNVCILFRNAVGGQASTLWVDDIFLGQ